MTDVRTPAFVDFLVEERRVKEFITAANLFFVGLPVLIENIENFPKHYPEYGRELREGLGWFVKRISFREDPTLFEQLWAGIMVSRSVDNFHSYIADMLLTVFISRPETLRSGAKVEVKEVLECGSIQEFAARVATRQVDELAFGGFASMRQYLTNRLGVELELDEKQVALASEAIAIRNVIVHNRGRADARFLRTVDGKDLTVGDVVHIDPDTGHDLCGALEGVARSIDVGLTKKFGIRIFIKPLTAE